MENNIHVFIKSMESRLKPPRPIEFETSETSFAPRWHSFATFISSYLEQVSRELADRHNYYLYHFPPLALVPETDRYIVFVKKYAYDTVYLGYNTAYVFSTINKHYYTVPHIPDSIVHRLTRYNINPVVLGETIYILPILSSIPCTGLITSLTLVRDYLAIRAQSYLVSNETALAMLGYILLKLLARQKPGTYEEVFREVKNIIAKVLVNKGFRITEKQLHVKYLGFPVDIYILKIMEHNHRSYGT